MRLNGYGMPGAEVLIKHDARRPDGSWSWSPDDPPELATLIDRNGSFILQGVYPGEYQLEIRVPYASVTRHSVYLESGRFRVDEGDVVQANVRFEGHPQITKALFEQAEPFPILHIEWAPHASAHEFGIDLRWREDGTGSNVPLVWPGMLEPGQTSVRIPMDQIPSFTGWSRTSRGHMALFPLFGVHTPGVELWVDFQRSVESSADPASRVRVTPGSDEPMIFLEPLPYEFSRADKLLIRRRYKDAIAAYERQVEADPNDVRSLQILAYIAYYGVDGNQTYRDPQRLVGYVDRLAELGVSRW